ncbi:MAG: type II toxin-antitoxin system HicB family antitoxin [Planctomycetota bacterium]|jgi:predicted RNase H-like HicB family nuclease
MLLQYIQAAMSKARYEILPDDGTYYGRIPGFKGVWANAQTLEECRQDLQSVLEDWILMAVRFNDRLPTINGLRVKLPRRSHKAAG